MYQKVSQPGCPMWGNAESPELCSEGRQSLTAALFIHYLSPIPASKLSAHRFSVHRQSPFSPAAFSGGCRLLCNPSAAPTSTSTAQGTGGTSGTRRHEITGLLSGTLTLPPVSLLPPPCSAILDPTPGEALVRAYEIRGWNKGVRVPKSEATMSYRSCFLAQGTFWLLESPQQAGKRLH